MSEPNHQDIITDPAYFADMSYRLHPKRTLFICKGYHADTCRQDCGCCPTEGASEFEHDSDGDSTIVELEEKCAGEANPSSSPDYAVDHASVHTDLQHVHEEHLGNLFVDREC